MGEVSHLIGLYQYYDSLIRKGELIFNITQRLGTTDDLDNPDMKLLGDGKSDLNSSISNNNNSDISHLFNPFSISDTHTLLYTAMGLSPQSVAIVRAGPCIYDYLRTKNDYTPTGKNGYLTSLANDPINLHYEDPYDSIDDFYMISLIVGSLTADNIKSMIPLYLTNIRELTTDCLSYVTTSTYIDAIIPAVPTTKYPIVRRIFRFHLRIFDGLTSLLMTFNLPYHQLATNNDKTIYGTKAGLEAVVNRKIVGSYPSIDIERAIIDEFDVTMATVKSIPPLWIERTNELTYFYDDDPDLSALINQLSIDNLAQLREITERPNNIIETEQINPLPYYYGLTQELWLDDINHPGVSDIIDWLKILIAIIRRNRIELLKSDLFSANSYSFNYYDHNYVYNWRLIQ